MNNDFLTTNGQTNTNGNKSFDIPDDIYDAVVIGIANMGEVETTFNGETKKSKKVSVAFALDYQFSNKEFAVVTQRYTLSLHEKSALGKMFAKIGMPKEAKLGDLLGRQVRVEITHNGDYTNVGSVLTASKVKLATPEVYAPTWWFTNNYEMGLATGVLGQRPRKEATCPANGVPTNAENSDQLPF